MGIEGAALNPSKPSFYACAYGQWSSGALMMMMTDTVIWRLGGGRWWINTESKQSVKLIDNRLERLVEQSPLYEILELERIDVQQPLQTRQGLRPKTVGFRTASNALGATSRTAQRLVDPVGERKA